MNYKLTSVLVLSVIGVAATHAVSFSWTGVSNDTGNTLKAKADFTAVGNVLTVVLSNESIGVSRSPADTLGTVTWNMSNSFLSPNMTNSASNGPSLVMQNNAVFTGSYDLNKEYMYEDAFTFAGHSFAHGLSSVGLGIFGTNSDTMYERMRGQGNAGSSAGDAFSISSMAGTSNAANNFAVVRGSMTFKLISNSPINLASINKVGFGYGSGAQTSGVVPEPGSALALGLGAAAMLRRRKK